MSNTDPGLSNGTPDAVVEQTTEWDILTDKGEIPAPEVADKDPQTDAEEYLGTAGKESDKPKDNLDSLTSNEFVPKSPNGDEPQEDYNAYVESLMGTAGSGPQLQPEQSEQDIQPAEAPNEPASEMVGTSTVEVAAQEVQPAENPVVEPQSSVQEPATSESQLPSVEM